MSEQRKGVLHYLAMVVGLAVLAALPLYVVVVGELFFYFQMGWPGLLAIPAASCAGYCACYAIAAIAGGKVW